MDDERIIEKDYDKTKENTSETWLVFKSGLKTYAIESCYIKEILRNSEVFKMPFVPPYVAGVLNFYGKPMAVIDFSKFIDNAGSKESLFLVLNVADDVAFQIDDVCDFYSSLEIISQTVANKADENFFLQSVIIDNSLVPVLNVGDIIKRIKKEIEK